jgi:hypothetical protein
MSLSVNLNGRNNSHKSRSSEAIVKNEREHNIKLDKNLFTFKPKLNKKSTLLTQNLISFYERQNLHTRKQLELVNIISFCFVEYKDLDFLVVKLSSFKN